MSRQSSTIAAIHGQAASAEWKFLLAASAGDSSEGVPDRIRSLLAQSERESIDWSAVLHLASRHGTSSLMYRNLAHLHEVVPADVWGSLRRSSETNTRRSLVLASEMMRILVHLDVSGVEVMPYKGVVLSELYYGDLALRPSGDIDLFIREYDLARISDAALELGYTPRVPISKGALRDYIASGYEYSFNASAGTNLLELQWALQPRFYAVDLDMNELFARAQNTTVAGRSLKTLAPADLLLVLAIHAAKHLWERLIWLCDIAQILKRESLDWVWVQETAREYGVERILHITLLLAKRLLGAAIPSELEKTMTADRAASGLADEIAAALLAADSYEERKKSYFRMILRLRERRSDQLRILTRLAFTPGPAEWEVVQFPRPLFPLYRLVRLARLASKFSRG